MKITLQTKGRNDIIDITPLIEEKLNESKLKDGALLVFAPGSTVGLTMIEYEPGVLNDLRRALEKLAPENIEYEHNEKWGDGNGYAHVRSALIKPSLTVPVENGKLALGTWQQIVLIDFDNRPRSRKVIVKTLSEAP